MRVICIESATWANGKDIGQQSIKKGSIYHVIEQKTGEEIREFYKDSMAIDGIWYGLLEVNGHHYSERFLEIPDDNELINEHNKEKHDIIR